MAYKIWLYPERWDTLKNLSLEDKGKILENIFAYSLNWEILHDGLLGVIFWFMKNRFDTDKTDYENRCHKNREVGKLGWRPVKVFDNQSVISETQRVISKPNSNSNSNSNSNKLKERVYIYKQEKSFYSFVDDFIDFSKPQIIYQLSKNINYIESQYEVVDKLINDWYTIEAIRYILNFIKNDAFRKNQIISIKKLREKDKDWVPYMVRMMDYIKEAQEKKKANTIPSVPGI